MSSIGCDPADAGNECLKKILEKRKLLECLAAKKIRDSRDACASKAKGNSCANKANGNPCANKGNGNTCGNKTNGNPVLNKTNGNPVQNKTNGNPCGKANGNPCANKVNGNPSVNKANGNPCAKKDNANGNPCAKKDNANGNPCAKKDNANENPCANKANGNPCANKADSNVCKADEGSQMSQANAPSKNASSDAKAFLPSQQGPGGSNQFPTNGNQRMSVLQGMNNFNQMPPQPYPQANGMMNPQFGPMQMPGYMNGAQQNNGYYPQNQMNSCLNMGPQMGLNGFQQQNFSQPQPMRMNGVPDYPMQMMPQMMGNQMPPTMNRMPSPQMPNQILQNMASPTQMRGGINDGVVPIPIHSQCLNKVINEQAGRFSMNDPNQVPKRTSVPYPPYRNTQTEQPFRGAMNNGGADGQTKCKVCNLAIDQDPQQMILPQDQVLSQQQMYMPQQQYGQQNQTNYQPLARGYISNEAVGSPILEPYPNMQTLTSPWETADIGGLQGGQYRPDNQQPPLQGVCSMCGSVTGSIQQLGPPMQQNGWPMQRKMSSQGACSESSEADLCVGIPDEVDPCNTGDDDPCAGMPDEADPCDTGDDDPCAGMPDEADPCDTGDDDPCAGIPDEADPCDTGEEDLCAGMPDEADPCDTGDDDQCVQSDMQQKQDSIITHDKSCPVMQQQNSGMCGNEQGEEENVCDNVEEEDQCANMEQDDPCAEEEDPCAAEQNDPCAVEENDPCAVEEDDPCATEEDDPCAVEEDDPCAEQQDDPCAVDEDDPCAAEEDDPCAVEEDDPCAKEEDDPCAVEQKDTCPPVQQQNTCVAMQQNQRASIQRTSLQNGSIGSRGSQQQHHSGQCNVCAQMGRNSSASGRMSLQHGSINGQYLQMVPPRGSINGQYPQMPPPHGAFNGNPQMNRNISGSQQPMLNTNGRMSQQMPQSKQQPIASCNVANGRLSQQIQVQSTSGPMPPPNGKGMMQGPCRASGTMGQNVVRASQQMNRNLNGPPQQLNHSSLLPTDSPGGVPLSKPPEVGGCKICKGRLPPSEQNGSQNKTSQDLGNFNGMNQMRSGSTNKTAPANQGKPINGGRGSIGRQQNIQNDLGGGMRFPGSDTARRSVPVPRGGSGIGQGPGIGPGPGYPNLMSQQCNGMSPMGPQMGSSQLNNTQPMRGSLTGQRQPSLQQQTTQNKCPMENNRTCAPLPKQNGLTANKMQQNGSKQYRTCK